MMISQVKCSCNFRSFIMVMERYSCIKLIWSIVPLIAQVVSIRYDLRNGPSLSAPTQYISHGLGCSLSNWLWYLQGLS